jgi:cytochrome c-type biogenesis protein CcmH
MRPGLGWIAIGLLLGICALALIAYGNPTSAQTLDQRTLAIAQQLRCPICQGVTVADSPSDISKAIRADIRRRLSQGESASAIKTYLLTRYPNISLAPSTSGIGSIAWVTPPLLLLAGVCLLAILVTDWRTRGRRRASAGDSYVKRVRAEVAGSGEAE